MCTNMQCVVGLSVLLFSVACAENCSTWLHPSGDGHNCLCGPSIGTVITKLLLQRLICHSCLYYICMKGRIFHANTHSHRCLSVTTRPIDLHF